MKSSVHENEENVAMTIIEKESIWSKIINFMKKIFNKNH